MASITFEGVSKVFPDGTLAVDGLDLEIADGAFAVIVGPSGSGKSTALRMVAGLEGATSGIVRIGDRVVNDVQPRHRDIAMVFQNYALYPHMSADDNLGFALKIRRVAKPERRSRVEAAARRLGIDALLHKRPSQLSGGQRQRVALGRAIVRAPQAFLMDEPLSNLDAKLRVEMRAYLAELHRELGTTTLYVTHDQTEALTMGDRVAVMRDGRLEQEASPREIYDRPANLFVARFIGSPAMNVVWGRLERWDGDGSHDGDEGTAGAVAVRLGEQHLVLGRSVLAERPGLADRTGQDILVGIRPEAFGLAGGETAAGSVLELTVALTELLGSDVLAHCQGEALTSPWSSQLGVGEDTGLPVPGLAGPTGSDATDAAAASGAAGGTDGGSVDRGGAGGTRSPARIAARLPAGTRVAIGDRLRLAIDPRRLHLFDPATGRALPVVDATPAQTAAITTTA